MYLQRQLPLMWLFPGFLIYEVVANYEGFSQFSGHRWHQHPRWPKEGLWGLDSFRATRRALSTGVVAVCLCLSHTAPPGTLTPTLESLPPPLLESNRGVPRSEVLSSVRGGLVRAAVGPLPRVYLQEKLIPSIRKSFTRPALAGLSQFSQIATYAQHL